MNDALVSLLRSVDTPTVCNAIEVVEGKRGFDQFSRGTPLISDPNAGSLVGYARTAKISAIEPPSEPADVIKERRRDYYRHMAGGPQPAIAVVEDIDGDQAIGAFWGEINTTVHKGLGVSGALTNGVMRDLGDLPEGFPVIAGSLGPSHGFVHVKEIGTPVTVFALTVDNGDLVHADRHGAVVIPTAYVDELGTAIAKLVDTEQIILSAARRPDFDLASFETAWAAFETART
jgi:regulator of RNase E activity RraA